MRTMLFILLGFISLPASTADRFQILPYDNNEFSPQQQQILSIPFQLQAKAKIKVIIHTPDNDPIRQLDSEDFLPPGKHRLIWDGRDANGVLVPDEAYNPVFEIHWQDGTKQTVDFRDTGGEVIEPLPVRITSRKNLSFTLPHPARVLARLGIKGGPMLKSLLNWAPRNRGKTLLHWDGYDQDKLLDIRRNPKLSILVEAYRLPEHAVLTVGNTQTSYRAYRRGLKTATPPRSFTADQLERNGKRIVSHYFYPKDMNLSPQVALTIDKAFPTNAQGLPIVQCPCPIRVSLANDDKPQLQESLYEIAFFIDNEFVSEQEQGYVPFTWRWKPSNLAPGKHILTVNVSGLRGEVGVRSLLFVSR